MAKKVASKVSPSKSQKIFCSVCPTWEIKKPEKCSNTLTYKKSLHYFCTKKCKERFEKAPEKFL